VHGVSAARGMRIEAYLLRHIVDVTSFVRGAK
jgi:hypothetical protein